MIAAAPSKTEKYAKFIIDNSVAKVDLNEKYFNAGVLMINLRLWKRRNKGVPANRLAIVVTSPGVFGGAVEHKMGKQGINM